MSGDVVTEAPRPRPLSGGLWTLFSWLRREERSSSESISSAGSDRTAASFAFLAPENYRTTSTPLVLPLDGPPTDSYKKRVQDRNLRRHHDRDLTLRRKYGLFRDIEGYDTFSLPSARRTINESSGGEERDRRATSECLYRRAAYVPGKRRAPLPPFDRAASAGPFASLPRRHSRKRPAPQPPVNFIEKTKETTTAAEKRKDLLIQMNAKATQNKDLTSNNDITMGCKPEKYSKKDSNSKDRKLRPEKSFLKQIFENKKRNSTIDTMSVKVLPSISELDKQATELIETYKRKELNNNVSDGKHMSNNTRPLSSGDVWICTRCLRKYEAAVISCVYCFPKEKLFKETDKNHIQKLESSASNISKQIENKIAMGVPSTSKVDEREKLKEMLKEMKDSLPKKSKHSDNNAKNVNKNSPSSSNSSSERNIFVVETPTLRIGTITNDKTPIMSQKTVVDPILVNCNNKNAEILNNKSQILKNTRPSSAVERCVVTQVVLIDSRPKDENIVQNLKPKNCITKEQNIGNSSKVAIQLDTNEFKERGQKLISDFKENKDLHTPLKISALLNPVYIPKNDILDKKDSQRKTFLSQVVSTNSKSEMKPTNTNVCNVTTSTASSLSQPSSSKLDNPKEINFNLECKAISKEPHSPTKEVKQTPLISTVVSKPGPSVVLEQKTTSKLPSSNQINATPFNINTPKERFSLEQHLKRRELINQLEQSIAKGDERAAAEAASKLAQLRLSCSVLSFSSQIVGDASPSASNVMLKNENVSANVMNKVPHVQNTPKIDNTTPLSTVFKENAEQAEQKNDINERTKAKEIKTLSVKIEGTDGKAANETNLTVSQRSIEATTSKDSASRNANSVVSIEVLVEDKDATRGPVRLEIQRQATMGDLRRQAETTFGVPAKLQRWIVGRALCTNDSTPLITLAGSEFKAPFYLCLVEGEGNKETVTPIKPDNKTDTTNDNGRNVYTELVQLEQHALVPNAETFQCDVCIEECAPGGGAVMRECVHAFCRECLADVVRHSEEPVVACPAMGCSGVLQEREIRALVSPEEYERWLARGLATAESGIRNSFHCRTRDCTGWALCEPGVQRFPCPVCKHINCVPCQAIHEGDTCEQHRKKIQEALATVNAADGEQTDESTRALLENLISKGEALECPECSAVITKKWGCDWVKCSACKTEICWVTRGRRWGPAGRGDTSGGCRCGVDGKRCHPSCGYCH